MATEPSKPVLLTARNYARYIRADGEAHSIIRVQNLSTEALVGGAIWGVPSDNGHRNVLQPVLLSSTLSLRQPFRSAAQSDTVNSSTVNYSTLSKEMIKVVASRRPGLPHSKDFNGLQRDWSMYDLIEWIQLWLTGYSPSGSHPPNAWASNFLDGACPCLANEDDLMYKPALLDIENLLELGFALFLPKATLLSCGVSLETSSSYLADKAYRSVLKIHGIRIPTLIGVNAKERLAKQLVVLSVEVDPYVCQGRDYYNELEQIIVKTTEESSFETLESLATHLSDRIIKYFIYAYTPFFSEPIPPLSFTGRPYVFSDVRIRLEKPSAVTFADAPSIEIRRSSNPHEDKDAERLWAEYYRYAEGKHPQAAQIPYPLHGALSAWISENCPGDST